MAYMIPTVGQKLRSHIIENIRTGRWTPGTALPGIRSLAEEFDISTGSVRNTIRDLAGAGVLETVHGKGTFVADEGASKALEERIAGLLLIMPVLPAVETLREMALERGIFLSHYSSALDKQDPAVERRLLAMARENRFLGVILTPTPRRPTNCDLFGEMRREGIKVLLTGLYDEIMEQEVFLLPDCRAATRAAAGRLALAGYRRFVCAGMTGPQAPLSFRVYHQGYADAVEELGLATLPPLETPAMGSRMVSAVADESAPLRERIRALPEGTAIVCRGGGPALLVRELLARTGRRVPEEIGLMGVQGVFDTHHDLTDVAHFRFDLHRLVAEAFEYVTDDTQSPAAPFQRWFRADFRPGPSAPPAALTRDTLDSGDDHD